MLTGPALAKQLLLIELVLARPRELTRWAPVKQVVQIERVAAKLVVLIELALERLLVWTQPALGKRQASRPRVQRNLGLLRGW